MAMSGTVKFFNSERGYGFIKPDDGGRDVFVHITAVEHAGLKSLAEGQRIQFEVEPDKKGKGPKAVNLVVTGCRPALTDAGVGTAANAWEDDLTCIPRLRAAAPEVNSLPVRSRSKPETPHDDPAFDAALSVWP